MNAEATRSRPLDSPADAIAVGIFQDEAAPASLEDLGVGPLIARGEADPRLGRLAVTHAGERPVIVTGLGRRHDLDAEGMRVAAAAAQRRAQELRADLLCWLWPDGCEPGSAAALVEGTLLRAYRFNRYRPSPQSSGGQELLVSSDQDLTEVVRRAAIVARAQNRARDLANTPANELPPSTLADYAQALGGRWDDIEVTVMDEAEIQAAGMGAFAAVAQGSAQSARLISLRYQPAGAHGPPLGLVGKAVTFDSGGLSLKSPEHMHEMKFDMAGGAAVLEAVAALAELGAQLPVLAVLGATENLPGPTAVRPGDIVRSLDGTTVEVNNTDAEGRLVLADCLTYAQREGASRLVDVATLTGAVVTALGSVYAGLMANDDRLADQLLGAANQAGELVWRLPLHRRYADMVAGRYAQLTNRPERREAQAITAAEFLHHFAGQVPWAHIDIAGTAYDVPRPYFVGKGATGFGVRLLVALAGAIRPG